MSEAERRNTPITIRLQPGTLTRLDELAGRVGASRSALVIRAVRRFLAAHERGPEQGSEQGGEGAEQGPVHAGRPTTIGEPR